MEYDLVTDNVLSEARLEPVDEFKSIRRLITQNTLLQRFIAKYVDKPVPVVESNESLEDILARLNHLINSHPSAGNRNQS